MWENLSGIQTIEKVFMLGADLQPGASIDLDYYGGQNHYTAPLIYIFYQKCFSFALTSGHIHITKHQDISLRMVTGSSRQRNQILDSFVLEILEGD